MEISNDQVGKKLWFNPNKYVQTILQRFPMHDYNLINIPSPMSTKLSFDKCPKSNSNLADMFNVPYVIVIGSICMLWSVRDHTFPKQWEF